MHDDFNFLYPGLSPKDFPVSQEKITHCEKFLAQIHSEEILTSLLQERKRYREEEKIRNLSLRRFIPKEFIDKEATKIQSLFRGYIVRKYLNRETL
jgi:hypothetical protein